MTWRYLWARLVALWRLHRTRFRYCYTCGVVLTPDETTACVECVEQHEKERAWFQQQADAEAARHIHSVPSMGVSFVPPRAPANLINALQNEMGRQQQNAYNGALAGVIGHVIGPSALGALGQWQPGSVVGPFTNGQMSQISGALAAILGQRSDAPVQ